MTEQQAHEKAVFTPALLNPGVKLLFQKFDDAAEKLPLQAIQALLADDIPKAKRIAYLYDTYKHEIPRMTQNIMNCEADPKKTWSFFNWLRNM